MSAPFTRVRRRQVFYLSGFDPRGAAHYHRLYREQAAQQAAVNGLSVEVSPRQRVSALRQDWMLRTQTGAETTTTRYSVLVWDDLVRRHWSSGLWRIVCDLGVTLRAYYFNGLVLRFARASIKQMIAGVYPLVYLLLGGGLLLAGAAGLLAGVLGSGLPGAVASPLGGIAVLAWLWAGRRLLLGLGNRLGVFWLQRIYVFAVRWARGELDTLPPRLAAFAAEVQSALDDPQNDEVLVVGHSVGTLLAVPVIDQVLARRGHAGRLALLTLGECIPLMSFQPRAAAYRASLQRLADAPDLVWLDYTAPTDGACFPLFDPITGSGLVRTPGRGPQIRSPRFFTLFDPARYRRLRRDWYTMHFLYLMATGRAGEYDYFAFTAGPQPLASRAAMPATQAVPEAQT
jgi:hypothetical protein